MGEPYYEADAPTYSGLFYLPVELETKSITTICSVLKKAIN